MSAVGDQLHLCPTCKTLKREAEFARSARRKSGLQRMCRSCCAAWHLKNKARRNREAAEWYLANKAVHNARSAAWTQANLEAHRERNRGWYKRNPARYAVANRAGAARRRAILAEVLMIPYTESQLEARLAFYGFSCWICGGPFEHLDHVKPLAAGGPHILANLRPACGSCNMSKSATWPFTPKSPRGHEPAGSKAGY